MRETYRRAWGVFRANLPILLLAAALLLAMAVAGQMFGGPVGVLALVVYVPLLYLLHRAVLRGGTVASAAGLREWRALGRFLALVVAYQLVNLALAALTMFVLIASPADPIRSLIPLGLILFNLVLIAAVGTAYPAAADGRSHPLRLGWAIGRIAPGRVALRLLLGPMLAIVVAQVAFAVLAKALGLSGAVVENGEIAWENLPSGLAYGLASLFAATLGVVVLCQAYEDGARSIPHPPA